MPDTQTTPDKRTAILQAALDLIAERGFHDTPMSLVARRSGASAGTIYHYFESKDEMITVLYRQIKADFVRALIVGDPLRLPAPERLKRAWLNSFHFYVNHPKETIFLEQYENSPYAHQALPAAPDEHVATLYRLTQEDIAQGLVKDLPLEVLYELSFGVAVALAKRQIAGTISLKGAMLEAVAEACWHAIRR